jgi:hypothetical protein
MVEFIQFSIKSEWFCAVLCLYKTWSLILKKEYKAFCRRHFWKEYLDLEERKKQENAAICVMRSFIICAIRQTLLGWWSQGRCNVTHGRCLQNFRQKSVDKRRLCDQEVDGRAIIKCSAWVWTWFNKPSIG